MIIGFDIILFLRKSVEDEKLYKIVLNLFVSELGYVGTSSLSKQFLKFCSTGSFQTLA